MAPHVEMFGHGDKWYPKAGTEHKTGDENSEGYKNAEGILLKAADSDDMYAREVPDEKGEVCEEHTESSVEAYPDLLQEMKAREEKK